MEDLILYKIFGPGSPDGTGIWVGQTFSSVGYLSMLLIFAVCCAGYYVLWYVSNNPENAPKKKKKISFDIPEEKVPEFMVMVDRELEEAREELRVLRNNDVVAHKFLGEGVVLDNSDHDNIVVQFGTEIRYINKEQAAEERLLRKRITFPKPETIKESF